MARAKAKPKPPHNLSADLRRVISQADKELLEIRRFSESPEGQRRLKQAERNARKSAALIAAKRTLDRVNWANYGGVCKQAIREQAKAHDAVRRRSHAAL